MICMLVMSNFCLQITQFLTVEELKLLNPQMWIVPRTFILKPEQVILLGGLARLDYVEVSSLIVSDSKEKGKHQ